MGRSPCCEKEGLKKGPWTPEEDQKLLAYVEQHGHGSWRALPDKAGLRRCGKSCRLRWTNYLRPDIKRGKFSVQEEQTIIQLHALLGNRWSAIASHLPKRTDNEIKNFWNTHLKKRLAKMGIDPVTHKPRGDGPAATAHGGPAAGKSAANLSHMAQWESARLEAEARLVRESKLQRSSASAGLVPATSPVTSRSSSSSTPPFPLPPPSSAASAPAELHNMIMSSPSSSSLPAPCSFDPPMPWQGRYWTPPPSRVAGGGAAHSSQAGGQPQVDLESPTSTLTYSENLLPGGSSAGRPDHGPSAAPHRNEIGGEEAVGWKHFPAAMVELFDPRERTDDHGDISWLHDPPFTLGPGTAMTPGSSGGGGAADGFTEMLLNESDRHNAPPEDGGACGDESRGYWSSILNLVNSSSPSSSPAGF